jgi:peptidyl-tRNA hydrolase
LIQNTDYFAKEQTFISNRQTGAFQNTNLKEEPFPLKPNTYMNLSGKGTYWMDKENISLENIFDY